MPVIQLELDSTGAITNLRRFDRAADATAANTQTAFSKMRGAVNTFGKAAGIAAAGFGVGLAAFSKQAIDAASDLEEAQGKFNVVFRGLTDQAEQWSQTLQDSYGTSEEASKRYLSSIQDLLVPTGLARDKAGEMSNQFVKLAVDLGSFNNLPTQKVIEDIQSALAGSSETLTKYGIDVQKAALEQEAMNLGLIKSKDEMTRQISAQALLSRMYKDSSDALGDFARTSDSYANQMKILEKNVQNITAAIGQQLIPMATELVTSLNQWIEKEDGVTKAINFTIESIRFLDNGMRGLLLVAKGATVVISGGFYLIAQSLRIALTPLNLFLKGLQQLGFIDTNPLDEMVNLTRDFFQAQVDGFKETYASIEQQNAKYDQMKAKVKATGEAFKESKEAAKAMGDAGKTAGDKITAAGMAATAVNNQGWKPSVDAVGNAYDQVARKAQKAGEAARRARAEWNRQAAAEAEISGVSVSIGQNEQRWTGETWTGPSSPTPPDSGGVTVNVNQKISRSDVVAITTEQKRQLARL